MFRNSVAILAGVYALWTASAPASSVAKSAAIIGPVHLERIYHDQNLLPDREHAGFGSLLFDADGKLSLHDGNKTWLYTTGLSATPTGGRRDWYGKWVSQVREFNIKTLVSGEKKTALGLTGEDQWAVIHDVIKVSDDLFVAFYSTNGGVRAAVGDKPDGVFESVPDFKIGVSDAWEQEGSEQSSLESNGAHVLIENSEQAVTLWVGYDSYHVDQTSGQLGWAKVLVDKKTRKVQFIEKYPGNPLPLLPANFIAARCGGNLSSDLRLGGQYGFFYYTRPNKQRIMLTVALSSDPLFGNVAHIVELAPPLGEERVIEKFETYVLDGNLHIIYENNLSSGHWGTGIMIYKIRSSLKKK